jgi:hypothetical protein
MEAVMRTASTNASSWSRSCGMMVVIERPIMSAGV